MGLCIVQVGANRGNDHVTELVRGSTVDTLLLIEPTPMCIPILRACYSSIFPSAIIEEVAIVPTKGEEFVDFYFWTDETVLPEPTHEANSLKKMHLIGTGIPEEQVQVTKVVATTLMDVLVKHNITTVDRLFIDIEGMDAEVLLSFPFTQFDVKEVRVETRHMGGLLGAVDEYMKGSGFYKRGRAGLDTIYSTR